MNEKCLTAIAGVCLTLMQGACGGGAGGPAAASVVVATPATPQPLGPVAPALVGTWTGTLQGSFGPGDLTMTLNADATMWFEGTGRYCRVDGRWGVSGAQFTASGGDCTGTVVTKTAPVSGTSLTGSWSASSGRTGTFSVTKQ